MPKLAVSKDEEMNRIIHGSIRNALILQGIGVQKLSKLTGIPESTLYEKIRCPEKLTFRESRIIFRVLKYTDEEKERIAREGL